MPTSSDDVGTTVHGPPPTVDRNSFHLSPATGKSYVRDKFGITFPLVSEDDDEELVVTNFFP